MKLVLAVVHDEDSHKLVENLSKAGFMTTKLSNCETITTIICNLPL